VGLELHLTCGGRGSLIIEYRWCGVPLGTGGSIPPVRQQPRGSLDLVGDDRQALLQVHYPLAREGNGSAPSEPLPGLVRRSQSRILPNELTLDTTIGEALSSNLRKLSSRLLRVGRGRTEFTELIRKCSREREHDAFGPDSSPRLMVKQARRYSYE
jgi:hypothetical protein